MKTIQIRNKYTNRVIFEHTEEDNTIKSTVEKAVLTEVPLCDADLRFANLRYADLYGVDLYQASLYGADLRGAKNTPYIPMNCPSDGAFIGWKKVNNKLIKLEIPADAKRSSATTYKCRCDKAKVLAITYIYGSNPVDRVINKAYGIDTEYIVGEMIYPDSYDDDLFNECSKGIHFFINKQDAINYK